MARVYVLARLATTQLKESPGVFGQSLNSPTLQIFHAIKDLFYNIMIDFAPVCSTKKKDKNKNNQHKNTFLQYRIANLSLDVFLMFASMSSYINLTVLILL